MTVIEKTYVGTVERSISATEVIALVGGSFRVVVKPKRPVQPGDAIRLVQSVAGFTVPLWSAA